MDIETFNNDKKNAVPYCICLKLNNIDFVFWYSDKEKIIINFLETICKNSEQTKIEIYTHNINFDGFILIDFLKKTHIKIEWFIRDLNLYWIEIYYLKHIIKIRCSYKIIGLSVEKLGQIINLNKGVFPYKFSSLKNLDYVGKVPDASYFEMPEDYIFFLKNFSVFDFKKIAIDYCQNDVLIVHTVLKEIINIINNLNDKIIKKCFTFSSLAYKIYSKSYDKTNITKIEISKPCYLYSQFSYYGGRCEVFGNPTKNDLVHYFDFPGMYGLCMLEKFPIGEPKITEKNLDINNIGFHTIKFKCDDYLPFLPYKSKKLYFSNGIIVGKYWYEEILNAIKHNKCKIIEHYSSMVYEKESYVFKDYVENFIDIRKKGKYYKIFGKNMVNGLYGSFALVDEDYISIIVQDENEFNSIISLFNTIYWKKINNIYIIHLEKNSQSVNFLKSINKEKSNSRNIAYASIIASKARIKLNNSLQCVLDNNGKLFYTDTDSIFAGFDTNLIGKQMGEIKWEEIYEDAVFITNKFYQIKGKKLKLKGINLKNEYDFEVLKKNFYENKGIINFSDQLNIEKKEYGILISNMEKKINLNMYDKRIFDITKKKTIPIWSE